MNLAISFPCKTGPELCCESWVLLIHVMFIHNRFAELKYYSVLSTKLRCSKLGYLLNKSFLETLKYTIPKLEKTECKIRRVTGF